MTGVGWETGLDYVGRHKGWICREDGWGGAKRGVETWRSMAGGQARHVLMTKSGWGPKTSTV